MIKASELRKGNLVKCVRHLPIGFHTPALSYAEITEIRDDGVETDEGVHKYRNIGPIKLTEDILVKSGGIKKDTNLLIFDKIGINSLELTFIEDYGIFYLVDEKQTKISAAVEYIHHFQNLYFFLTRSEVRIVI